MGPAAPTPRPKSIDLQSLADRLREGPLRTLLTLQVRAGMLAGDTDDDRCLEKLVELVELAQEAMGQFQDVTHELRSVVDEMTAALAAKQTTDRGLD
jgi:DNA-binding FadR family transcriptional regulator